MFEEKLKKRLIDKGYNIDESILKKMIKYKDMLLEWNEKMNLTAITNEDDIIEKHFVDCLEITKFINKKDKILDVGTGAGFPGIVIAIYFNGNIDITLLDGLNKRLIFLSEVIKELNLKNVNIVHGRAEEYAHKELFREKFDIVVSRAVANLNSLSEYSIPFLKMKGKCLFMKADSVFEEINTCDRCFKILNSEILEIYKYILESKDEMYTRYIVVIQKNGVTNSKYPRSFSKIKNSPL